MTASQAGVPARRSPRAHAAITYAVLFVIALAPIVALGVYAHRAASTAIDRLVRSNNLAAATLTRGLVEQEFTQWVGNLVGFARQPGLIDSVRRHDAPAVASRLEPLVESQPHIVRAFVTDPEGLLWSDYPPAPESLGQTFAHRDWYRGLSASWQPYVSAVYRRHAAPRLLLVAIAAPIRDPDSDRVIGAVVYQVTPEALTRTLRQLVVGHDGFVYLIDHAGALVAHPGIDLQAREYNDYADSRPVTEARAAGVTTVEYADPLSRADMLATAVTATVAGHQWVVVAQQPLAAAFRATRLLAAQIGGAGLQVFAALSALFFVLGGYHVRMRRLNLRLGHLNRALSRENQDRRLAEQALSQANDQLERRVEDRTRELRETEQQLVQTQKMEAIGRLAGGIAHDFNNMLTVIIGYADLILHSPPKDESLRAKVVQIHDAGVRASTLTKQLLAFSRKQVLKPEIIDLNDVLRRMDQMMRRLIGEDIDLLTTFDPDLDPVEADPGQIEQIIMNLAVNARDAMPGGGKLTIGTANVDLDPDYARTHPGAQPGWHVMIAVADTGCGFDAATRARIFEPFFSTKKDSGGTGLGLSTVYGIVKQSGGNIWVYSEPGKGTTFKVYLPRAEQAGAEAKARIEAQAPSGGTETILVVEDEDGVRSLVCDVLTSAAYTVIDTGEVERAIEICRRYDGPIDLLLTDVVMPGMNGRELATAALALRPDLRVVYMSGYTDDAIVHHGVLDPGTAFIEKPVTPRALLEKIRDALH
ncbi:MAG TPA: ATP-binding protein [Alphaproteobacteria bacterium]